ncbi:MAG: hypothetical protein H6729_04130 [Deltaproteobacteria bacterium]|nr:hypothetical protein [Deltaproteobacteria bacterium]
MRYIVGLLLLFVGAVLGLVGDYPIDHPAYRSLGLLMTSGFLVASGVAVLLIVSGARGGREDEPPSKISPY